VRLCDQPKSFHHTPQKLTITVVSLDQLSAQQLTAVKKQLDEEVEHLTTSFAQLQAAQIKFKDCLRCVKTQGSTQGEWIRGGYGSHISG
jgi:prefoldin subunit 5